MHLLTSASFAKLLRLYFTNMIKFYLLNMLVVFVMNGSIFIINWNCYKDLGNIFHVIIGSLGGHFEFSKAPVFEVDTSSFLRPLC